MGLGAHPQRTYRLARELRHVISRHEKVTGKGWGKASWRRVIGTDLFRVSRIWRCSFVEGCWMEVHVGSRNNVIKHLGHF